VGNVTGTEKSVVVNVKLLECELDVFFREFLTTTRFTWNLTSAAVSHSNIARTQLKKVAHGLRITP
jgi:hypothetical protein